MKKETGSTTLMAAMATDPIQLPTKMVSTRILSDITNIPIDAGTACLINKLGIDSVPNKALFSLEIVGFDKNVLFTNLGTKQQVIKN